jgi:hypothetical protein
MNDDLLNIKLPTMATLYSSDFLKSVLEKYQPVTNANLGGFLKFLYRYFSKIVEPKGKRWSERLVVWRKAVLG